jgi:tRNA uridine 5-carboxymethylaminomethyl modification enzyme
VAALAGLPDLDPAAAEAVEIDVKYAGYVHRAAKRAEEAERMEAVALPPDVDWSDVHGLSTEARERLAAARPTTLGAVGRLPGLTPAAVNAVATWLARNQLAGDGAKASTGQGRTRAPTPRPR